LLLNGLAASAAVLAQWQFDTYSGGAFTNAAPQTGVQSGSATLYSILPAGGQFNSVTGTTLGAADSQATSAFQMSQTGGNRTYRLGMIASGGGWNSFVLSFSGLSTSGETVNWAYSLNGTTYTSFASTAIAANGTWASYTVDFSSVSALNNASTVYFQGTVNLSGNSKNVSFDNLTLTAVPEPTIVAGGIFAGIFTSIAVLRHRRSRRS
jgi:hypothetical protein